MVERMQKNTQLLQLKKVEGVSIIKAAFLR